MDAEAERLIELLSLAPHPEGGFYRETFRSPMPVDGPVGRRTASTAIYYLLPAGQFSALHRVCADEAWHHYLGDPLELHLLSADGTHERVLLGSNLPRGERPQAIVPAGVLQAARPLGDRFTLVGCTVAPGFELRDFELPSRRQLLAEWPDHAELISALTHPDD
jgi:predicted cupin superfamily sugar epimerase